MKQPHDAEWANALRWKPGDTGHYEVYYLTLNHLKSMTGFWIRYTMTAPEHEGEEPYAQIWFSFFNYRDPDKNFGLKQKYNIEDLKSETGPFRLRIGDNELANGRAAGGISGMGHEASWDIEFEPSKTVHLHLPKALYKISLADTMALCPHLDVAISGKIKVDGATLELKHDPGDQTHLWGEKHAQRWAWAHCNEFAEDKTAVFEGLSVQIKRLGMTLPPMNLLAIRYRDVMYPFTEIGGMLQCSGKFETGLWQFRARRGNIMFRGEISCRDQDMICAEYFDPDGERAYCHNSEVGSATVRVYKRPHALGSWRHEDTLTSLGAMHQEYAVRTADPRVKKIIEEIP